MTVESIRATDKPHVNIATLARAERLAVAGFGWSVDQVIRRALDLLEDQHSSSEPAGRTFTRDEIRSAIRGNGQETRTLSPSDERYLLALAAAFGRVGDEA